MAKNINYPTAEWLEKWEDKYLDEHPNERITDFDALRTKAEEAWWDNEIDHDRPTPFDLTPEQEKVVKEIKKGMAGRTLKAPVHRERKPDDEKRAVIALLTQALVEAGYTPTITNIERQVDFGNYSITLIKHRPPKSK